MKFRSKPATCNAVLFREPSDLHVKNGVKESIALRNGDCSYRGIFFEERRSGPPVFYVVTAHGQRAYLADGDYVVEEPDGRGHYPVKPDIFGRRWEAIPE